MKYSGVEIYLILVTVFSVVFGATMYFQTRLYKPVALRRRSKGSFNSTRLIDWIILISVTGLLAYIIR